MLALSRSVGLDLGVLMFHKFTTIYINRVRMFGRRLVPRKNTLHSQALVGHIFFEDNQKVDVV